MKNNMILFDLVATQPSVDSKRHGGGKYGEVIFKRIVERQLPVSCIYDSRRWINPEIRNILKKNDIKVFDISTLPLQGIIDQHQFRTIFTALPNRMFYSLKNITIIGTVHGLRRLETPADSYCFLYKTLNWKDWLFYFTNKFLSKIIKRKLCNYYLQEWSNPNFNIVTVSNHTRSSIKVYFPQYKDKDIPVFYSPSTSLSDIQNRKYDEKFFMLVSANRLEKNNLRAIKSLDFLFSNGYLDGYKVKITGAKDATIYRYQIKNIDRFEFLGYVNDVDLEQLYHDAYALIYPSLNEGFGYPPLEAMHYGVPVLSSPYTSIPEVCGDANLYFNPFSVEEIASRILQISDSENYEIQKKKAKAQYEKITLRQNEDLDRLIDYIFNYV